MREFMQPVRNCSECNQKTYSILISEYLCGANNELVTYSFKNGCDLRGGRVRAIIFVAVLLLSACEQVSNDLIIVEKDKCLRAGMDYGIGDWGRVLCVHPK